MARFVAFALLVATIPASADRKEAGPDIPSLADVIALDLELAAEPGAPKCQKLAWSFHLDLVTNAWVRSRTQCSDAGSKSATVSKQVGTLDRAARARIEAQYKALDARVPRRCDDSTEPVLVAKITRRDRTTVQLVDIGCERPALLRELAQTVVTLKP